MKPLSIEPHFLAADSPEALRRHLPRRLQGAAATVAADLRRALDKLATHRERADLLRLLAAQLAERGEVQRAIELMQALLEASPALDGDTRATAMQVTAALQVEADLSNEALVTASALLTEMAQEPRRKDEPFLSTLAALLFDIAWVHNARGQYKQAERELEKSLKLYERLAKTDPGRYGPAHILAQNASTQVYRSRVKQVNMLAHNQVATSTYLEMLNSGIEGAAERLIESLATEGHTLAQMGRYREAVQYYSRALKYLVKLEPEFSERQLDLSIGLGQALLNVAVSRDKGIHLLNTMLHKATKLGATEQHRRIVDILLNAKSRRLDILGFWHKVFPR